MSMSISDATVYSLQYGSPLLAFMRIASLFVETNTTNKFSYSPELITPNDTRVVLPNVDTLYSTSVFDLSQKDLELGVPSVDADRYWNYAFYDPFGDNFANVGMVNSNPSGKYLVRRAADCHQPYGFQPSSDPKYKGYINSPNTDGTILVRYLVKNNGSDLDYVANISLQSTLEAVPRRVHSKPRVQPLTSSIFVNLSSSIPLETMQLTARFAVRDLPIDANETATVNSNLARAGISNGVYCQPPGLNLTATSELASSQASVHIHNTTVALSNGWSKMTPMGLYGDDYIQRRFVADEVYLGLIPTQALYPQPGAESNNTSLPGGQAYLYTFASKPPVANGGFWSLTMYNATGYLVSNPVNVYSVGDRSNITYANGDKVYEDNMNSTSTTGDGPFQVLVQSASAPPPANWTANWLPSPPDDDEQFSITLRLYAPTGELIHDHWEYPEVAKVDAFF